MRGSPLSEACSKQSVPPARSESAREVSFLKPPSADLDAARYGGRPVRSSHFSPDLAPQVGKRTIRACSLLGFHGYIMQPCSENKMFNCDQCNGVAAQPAMSPFDQTNAPGSANVEVCVKTNL